jgi:hypothetical protein
LKVLAGSGKPPRGTSRQEQHPKIVYKVSHPDFELTLKPVSSAVGVYSWELLDFSRSIAFPIICSGRNCRRAWRSAICSSPKSSVGPGE